jgi:hypothetical protein
MGDGFAVVIACLVVLLLLVLAARWCVGPRRDRFFTLYAQEEPTRSYTPYTGTVPLGHWGDRPWAEVFPLTRGGEFRCYGSVTDVNKTFAPLCRICGGSRNYHDSVQCSWPHSFEGQALSELLPYQVGPYWEGGMPLLN